MGYRLFLIIIMIMVSLSANAEDFIRYRDKACDISSYCIVDIIIKNKDANEVREMKRYCSEEVESIIYKAADLEKIKTAVINFQEDNLIYISKLSASNRKKLYNRVKKIGFNDFKNMIIRECKEDVANNKYL